MVVMSRSRAVAASEVKDALGGASEEGSEVAIIEMEMAAEATDAMGEGIAAAISTVIDEMAREEIEETVDRIDEETVAVTAKDETRTAGMEVDTGAEVAAAASVGTIEEKVEGAVATTEVVRAAGVVAGLEKTVMAIHETPSGMINDGFFNASLPSVRSYAQMLALLGKHHR